MWDVNCYYSYLPATLVYGDLTVEDFSILQQLGFQQQNCTFPLANGGFVMKFSSGMALLYAPFFALAHVSAPWFGYEQTGYNPHYSFFLRMSLYPYLLAGLIALMLLLRRWFTDNLTALTILIIGLGTNLFYYASIEPNMSHTYTFSLVSIALLLIPRWFEQPNVKTTIYLGLLFGLIALIRPTNVLFVVLLPLYQVLSLADGQNRAAYLWKHRRYILLMMAAFLIPWLPQFTYWFAVTGKVFYYSYGHEKLNFTDPHILDGLISYRKGWLLYTPVMIAGLLGIPLLRRYSPGWFWPVLVFTPINIYIVFSWWCWWYGGSFGQRPMIDSYPLLALPLASMLHFATNRQYWVKMFAIVLMGALLGLNLFQTWQRKNEIIHWDSMTKEAYWESFMRLKPSPSYSDLLKGPLDDKEDDN